ncbi:MAG: N-acetylmannosamine-6-phosphate 2-epimerase [Eubacteriales bacterium]|nr:N-acetylmannosamine-6-phosphate 2-epimerase [Eubacteriales bacterium]
MNDYGGYRVTKGEILNQIKGGLIVSCQALEDEPLHDSYIMSRMAYAAQCGGAKGIRANSVSDIQKIKESVRLPMIGIIKTVYPDSQVYITPTMREIDALAENGVEIIAMDGTDRIRPGNMTLEELFGQVREKYPDQLFMADCATLADGLKAETLGFDLVGTTLCGYTEETRDVPIPNYGLIHELSGQVKIPVIAEGGIWSPEQLKRAMENRAFAAVIGTAITRPREITQRYVNAIRFNAVR